MFLKFLMSFIGNKNYSDTTWCLDMGTLYTLCISFKISFAPTSQHTRPSSLCQHLHDSISVFQGLAPNGGHSDPHWRHPRTRLRRPGWPPTALWSSVHLPSRGCLAIWTDCPLVARVLAWSVYVAAWRMRQKTDLSHPFCPSCAGCCCAPRTSEAMRWVKAMKSASPRLYNPES